ncbi:Mu transposase domain-containing protein [Streptomyces noursei]|uniref:Mu transposase domain-containing protein n=1 Tax=Streptomyces noursei TaxID=1971 RepID=UPI0035E3D2C6
MVSGYSRVTTARMLASRKTGDLIDGHWRLLTAWGRVPKMLVWDNEAGVGQGRPTSKFAAFAGLHQDLSVSPAGSVSERAGEAGQRLSGDLLPAQSTLQRSRRLQRPADGLAVANRRVHRTLGTRPTDLWEAGRAGMLTLPPVDPPAWWRLSTRLGRDHYVCDTCDYSVAPTAIGRQVTVLTDNDRVIVLTADGEIVAEHSRCWARHQTLTDPEHAEAGERMRHQTHHHHHRHTGQIHAVGPGSMVEVEQRELGSYDRLFTVIDGGADKEAG